MRSISKESNTGVENTRSRFAGFGSARQGEKAAGLKGYLISKPVKTSSIWSNTSAYLSALNDEPLAYTSVLRLAKTGPIKYILAVAMAGLHTPKRLQILIIKSEYKIRTMNDPK